MARVDRVNIIKKLEKERNTKLITYITSTRVGLEVHMAIDVIRKVYDHLSTISEEEKGVIDIDLMLVSNGGDGTVPWKLVTLIREFSKLFSVLIPYRAFSAATLTALGADSIVMHPMGMLGPTDPTVANPFNPQDPANPNNRLGISVEDVSAYISLIKEDAGITHEDELVQAFNKLADKVHPLALGNVKRSISQSRMMATKLLSLHMNRAKEQHEITEIVDNLTSKLYFHGHPINRKEAKEQIGLKWITYPTKKVEDLMWKLFIEYEKELKTEDPFNPIMEFIANNRNLKVNEESTYNIISKLAFVESTEKTDYVEMEHEVYGKKLPNGSFQVTPNLVSQGWKIEK
jgi:hypothetical protein